MLSFFFLESWNWKLVVDLGFGRKGIDFLGQPMMGRRTGGRERWKSGSELVFKVFYSACLYQRVND